MFDWVINLLHAISIGLNRMKRMVIDEEACSELASNEWDERGRKKRLNDPTYLRKKMEFKLKRDGM